VSVRRLHLCGEGAVRGDTSRPLQVRPCLLLRLRRELARSGQVPVAKEVDQEVRRRLGDVQLDRGQYQRVSQVQRDHREGRRLQPHGVQEPELQARVLLGLSRFLGAARLLLVQLQSLRRGRGQDRPRCPGEAALLTGKVGFQAVGYLILYTPELSYIRSLLSVPFSAYQ